MIEKTGIEIAKKPKDGEKTAADQCEHPKEFVLVDGDARFCQKCEKYLPGK